KEINIDNLQSVNTTTSPFMYPTVYSVNDVRVVVRIQGDGVTRPHWFKTTNKGTTWEDLGDMRPEYSGTIYPLLPENLIDIPANENFAVLFSKTDSSYSGGAQLHCCVAAKGSLQNIPGFDTASASSM